MRFILLACVLTVAVAAAEPGSPRNAVRPQLEQALKTFRTEGPKGWSFTQTTRGEGHSRVERYDAAQPEFDRWTLLQEDDPAAEADATLSQGTFPVGSECAKKIARPYKFKEAW